MKQTIALVSLLFSFTACAVEEESSTDDDLGVRISRPDAGVDAATGTGSGSGSGSGSGVITPVTMKCCAGENTNNYCPKEEKDKDGLALQYKRYNGYWIDTAGAACSTISGYGYEVSAADGGTKDKCGDYEEYNHAGDGCTAICNWDALCPGQ